MIRNPKYAHPDDVGPCPVCGEEMGEEYEDIPGVLMVDLKETDVKPATGRYWHMMNKHETLEDYFSPGSVPDYWIEE